MLRLRSLGNSCPGAGRSVHEMRGVLERRGDRVGDDVVHETCTHRSRKAKKADLDRGWPAAEHRRAAIVRISSEIDGNVDLL